MVTEKNEAFDATLEIGAGEQASYALMLGPDS